MEGVTPLVELVTFNKPTDVPNDKCQNMLASCLPSCSEPKARCSVELTLKARASIRIFLASFC